MQSDGSCMTTAAAVVTVSAEDSTSAKTENQNAFVRAVKVGALGECRRLLERCCSAQERRALVNSTDKDLPMLIVAIRREFPNVVKLLLHHGADACHQ
eukprot:6456774-Prymnesium_polylepis.1